MVTVLFLFLAGALTGLAFPPYGYWPLLFIIYPFFCFTLVKTTSKRHAFFRGWSFGFGQYIATLYWVSLAFISPGIELGWALPFLLIGLPLGLGLFTGLVGLLYKLVRPRQAHVDLISILLFTSLWSVGELIRGYALTGFPWNLMGTVFWETPLFQSLAVWGIYGLSFITVFVITVPLLIRRNPLFSILTPLLIIGGLWWWGDMRLQNNPTKYHDGPYIRLVQAHIDQGVKWHPELAENHLKAHIDLSMQESAKPLTHVVWPETAISYILNEEEEIRKKMTAFLPASAYLITGSIHYTRPPQERLGNSLYVMNSHGDILATYAKQHLIPFAEYVPFRKYIPMNKLVFGPIDYSPGEGLKTIHLENTPPFSPLICYEVIFPGEVVKDKPRPEWMLNLTNDGWYGLSSGPYQHLEITRMRTIEEGMPLVRSTNTGISAIIDSYGRLTVKLGLGEKGRIDGALPKSIERTIFAQGGKYIIFFFIGFILLPYFLFWRRKGYLI